MYRRYYFQPGRIFYLLIICVLIFACNQSQNDSKRTSSLKGESNPSNSSETELTIEYIAHASFLLHHDNQTLLLDPYADSVWISYSFPKNISADAIFSTHPHYDHDGGIFRDLKPYWQGKIPFYQAPGKHEIGNFKMEGIKGKHSEPYGKEFGQKNTIWIFEVGGLRIAHWGDNEPINDTIAAALTDIDVLMVPIDDTYHILKKEELAEVLSVVNPRIIIPMHYKIAALEPREGHPKNLGTIEKYVALRKNVIHLKGNTYSLKKSTLPKSPQYLVFQHSNLVH
jgi:L-ascorbate metabolism protein UlaG (beta-lactamase superfamily)